MYVHDCITHFVFFFFSIHVYVQALSNHSDPLRIMYLYYFESLNEYDNVNFHPKC